MKKLLSIVLALLMLCSLAACEIELPALGGDDDAADAYIKSAERLIKKGDLEGAKEVLEEALDEIDSEEIEELLEEVEEMLEDAEDNELSEEEVAETTAPFVDEPETEPTEAPTPTELEKPVICVFYYNGATRYALKEHLTDPGKYMESDAEVAARYGNDYLLEEYRKIYGDNLLYNDDDRQYNINLFMSNFAETHFREYPCSEYSMLCYALNHNKVNNSDKITSTREYYCMEKSDVNSVLTMYFGKTINPTSYQEYYYDSQYPNDKVIFDGSKFCYPLADGVLSDFVAVADYMHKNPDGTYYVSFAVYHATYGAMSNYYGASAQAAQNSSYLDYWYSGEAVVRDYTRVNGVESYQLISLTTND